MSVRSLCLAILSFGDATGYEIRKESTEGKFSYFEDASFGSIYPALARLEADGLVTVREELQDGKPTRKVYSITEAGRAEFLKGLTEPQAADTFKSPFLLVALYAEHIGPDAIEKAIERRRGQVQAELDTLVAHGCDDSDPASCWTRSYGVACMTFTLNYLAAHGEELVRIAQGANSFSQAAAAE
ncbi:PadR family transcriptional regulator [Roseibium polysiphoniae]|uniref:PadR family transcriptional regulator n=1 Tax=Roseibium polysiphoniae TaxID=2571221 RepID=UPI003297D2C0